MRDLCTSQNQACWQERIRKEAAARVAWKINYGHKYPQEGPLPRQQLQRAPFSSALGVRSWPGTSAPKRTGLPETKEVWDQPSRKVGVQGPQPREAQRATRGSAGQTKPEGLGMRQVAPSTSTLQLLFQGISRDGQGRASYLRERHRLKPEEKFQYPIVSSWEYGWHLGDAVKDTKLSEYARSQPIIQTFYIKSSVFNFPRRTDQLM
ncbi:protein ATP6V1FNB [Molossus molossus]|uniref:Sperm microtubule inner protein 1 C-terminal domain-containing protein n=1 Tax=Molossus molossus TaxID=27622 RepID=A0A7J8DBU6_MOLMO|nr:protein ATP6V1FNB [Molossus molossus]KAF6420598.1 hypothetical protein HJG59_009333 [Molossus molossus]